MTTDEAKPRHEGFEFAWQVLVMTVNDYIGHRLENLGRLETDLEFERWRTPKNQKEAHLE